VKTKPLTRPRVPASKIIELFRTQARRVCHLFPCLWSTGDSWNDDHALFRFRNRTLPPSVLGVVLAALAMLLAVPGFGQPAIPAGPAGEVLQAFLKAFNSGDRAALETFVKRYDPADTGRRP
jgi:hypothetical protein